MKFVCYSAWDQLPDFANVLFALAERDCIFYSRPWFEHVAITLDDDQELLLACVVDGSKMLAILPLIKSAGDNFHALKHRYTAHYSLLLAEPDHEQQPILACLAQGLDNLPIRSLLLEPVADDDSRIAGLQEALAAIGFSSERHFRHYNWIYRVADLSGLSGQPAHTTLSFKDYFAARPARLRNTIARKQRKLDREHGYEIHLYIGEDVPPAMSDYYAVYTASWKANEQYVDFLDGVVEDFSRSGWSRLAVLYVKGKPVAAQLWFVVHGKASIFRLSYDEAWKSYSPGSILTCFLMEYVIEIDKVEEIDFLTGNDTYKQDWMSERRECIALSCVKHIKHTGRMERIVASLKRMLTK